MNRCSASGQESNGGQPPCGHGKAEYARKERGGQLRIDDCASGSESIAEYTAKQRSHNGPGSQRPNDPAGSFYRSQMLMDEVESEESREKLPDTIEASSGP
jgi:hypothetical protein